MTVATIPQMDVGDVLSLQQLVYSWEDSPLTPEKAQSLELLVVRAVRIASGLQYVWTVCAEEGSVWETSYYSHRIRLVETLALTVVSILTRANELVERTRAKHPEWVAPAAAAAVQPSLVAARQFVGNARKLLEWLDRTRPPVDEEMIRRSQESLSRNEGEAVGDIIARLNNGGPLVKE